MGVSVTDPIGPSIERAGRMLFKPFNVGKWFTLGFAAWLAHLGEGGGGNFNLPTGGGGGGGGGPGPQTAADVVDEVKQFLLAQAHWLIPVVLVALLVWAVIVWIRARGRFIFVENVALDRAAIVEPWKRLRPLANSYFWFDLILQALLGVALLSVAAGAFLVAWPDIDANTFGPAAITALVGGVLLFLLVILAAVLVGAVAHDFVIPLMYLRGNAVGPAWGEFRTRLLAGNMGSFVLFYLMRVVLGIAIATAATMGTCLTCCLAGLPYLGTVILLPLFVFSRSYPLYFLRQFGPEYDLLKDSEPVPVIGFPVVLTPAPPVPPGQGH